jgi:hypothetical protein
MPNIEALPDEPAITFPARRNYIDDVKIDSVDDWKRLMFNDMRLETLYEAGSDDDAVQRNEISVTHVYIYPVSINAVSGSAL